MKFDPNLQRVYVVNTAANSVSFLIHNNSCIQPASLPPNQTVTVGITPKSVAPLADGTRVYVANSGDNTVSVIDAGSFKVRSTIPVGATPVSVAAAANSSRVYTANAGGSVSIITTSNDQVFQTLNAPACSAPTGSTTPACGTQSPNFVMMSP
jgi:YVTN family beta-propeller protein